MKTGRKVTTQTRFVTLGARAAPQIADLRVALHEHLQIQQATLEKCGGSAFSKRFGSNLLVATSPLAFRN